LQELSRFDPTAFSCLIASLSPVAGSLMILVYSLHLEDRSSGKLDTTRISFGCKRGVGHYLLWKWAVSVEVVEMVGGGGAE
jgi:hypothetical protein